MYHYVCERKKERTGSRRALDSLKTQLRVTVCAKFFLFAYRRSPFLFPLVSFCLSAHWFRSISHAVARSFFLSPNSRLALSFLCPLHSLACFYLLLYCRRQALFLTVFLVRTSPLPCGVFGRSSDARSFMSVVRATFQPLFTSPRR